MIIILTAIFFVLGAIIGSFLNVVIFRLNTHRSFWGRSGCMTCHKKLHWYELFPIFSYLFLKGRCKGCRTRISLQYPIVEFITGLIFAGLFLKFKNTFFLDTIGFTFSYAYFALIFSIMIVISIYDLRHKIIPDILSLFLGILSFLGLFLFIDYKFILHFPSFLEILSGIIIALPFALMWFLSKGKWMGFGDAKLAVSFGWLLGLTNAFLGVLSAFWAGAIFGIFLIILSKKHSMKSAIPFAPFLVFGAILSFFFELKFLFMFF